jgi:hypothetical protein
MNLTEVTQFKIDKKNLINKVPDDRYSFDFITSENFEYHLATLEKLIYYSDKRLSSWAERPNLDDVVERLKFGSICELWNFEGDTKGWTWFNTDKVTTDWKSSYQPLRDKKVVFVGGAFMPIDLRPENNSGRVFYTNGYRAILDYSRKKTIYIYFDNWNTVTERYTLRCGGEKYNYLLNE